MFMFQGFFCLFSNWYDFYFSWNDVSYSASVMFHLIRLDGTGISVFFIQYYAPPPVGLILFLFLCLRQFCAGINLRLCCSWICQREANVICHFQRRIVAVKAFGAYVLVCSSQY